MANFSPASLEKPPYFIDREWRELNDYVGKHDKSKNIDFIVFITS